MTTTTLNVPDELKQFPQWVLWRYEIREGKKTKVPYRTDGRMASTTDANSWASFNSVLAANSTGNYDGIGFVVTVSDDFCGVDLDHCRNSGTGEIEQWAKHIVTKLNSYTEITPSMQGVRVWLKGKIPPGGNRQGNIEIYEQGRYFTITGKHLDGTPITIEHRQPALSELHANLFSPVQKENKGNGHHSNRELADTEILQKALAAANGAAFSKLWQGDTSNYDGDDSRADLALCAMLAFWTGNDWDHIDTLFRQSGLYRQKWERKDYRERTITTALRDNHETYNPGSRTIVCENEQYRLTDLGNAERLVRQFGNRIRYCYERKSWLIWNGKVWQWDAGNLIVKLAIETIRGIYAEATNAPDKEKREATANHGLKSENSSRIDAMVDKARALVPINIHQLDANSWLFNVNNGTIDLRTGQLQPHDSHDFNTVLVPIEYNPNAVCPQWDQFLIRVTDNSETLRQYLQRAVGYSLTEDIKLQVFFFLYGTGNNGKSTFIMTIRRILGAYGTKLAIDDLMTQEKKNGNAPNEEIADLRNKRFVFASEIEQGRRLAVGLIKDMTGGETVKVRHLYGSPFEFSPTFKLWISGNHKPVIADTTLSIWRRLKMIPFTVTIPFREVDENLPSKLEGELDGILAWAVQGCLDYQKHGIGEPEVVKTATSAYRRDEDILAEFIEDKCKLKPAENDYITKATMKELYVKWCEENGITPLGQKNFKTRLIEKGVRDGHTPDKKNRAWWGISEKIGLGQNDGQRGQNEGDFTPNGQNEQVFPVNPLMKGILGEFKGNGDILSRRGCDSVQDRKNPQNPDKMTAPIFTSNELLINPCSVCGATSPVVYGDSFACGNCHPGFMNELLDEPNPAE